MNLSRVAIVTCRSYDSREVRFALEEGLALLGGLDTILAGRRKILLKPNLLHGEAPERGITTHPSLLRAAAELCLRQGCSVSYGDSPSFHNPKTAARRAGFEEAARETGIDQADFESGEERPFPDGRQNRVFFLARGALEADAIINLPKMKTHGLTVMTGALKNMFGVIPGLKKAWFHAKLPDPKSFSRMIVDLNRFVTPALSVMDAVAGMEGNGPRNGTLVHSGLLLLSNDPVALDATASRIMGIEPREVPTLEAAMEAGFGRIAENEIEIVGRPLGSARGRPYKLNPHDSRNFSSSPLQKHIKRFVVPRPVIDRRICTACSQCVRICPVKPAALEARINAPPVFDYRRCIRCFCCQETCPQGAIKIRVPLPGLLFHGPKKRL